MSVLVSSMFFTSQYVHGIHVFFIKSKPVYEASTVFPEGIPLGQDRRILPKGSLRGTTLPSLQKNKQKEIFI